MGDMRPTLVWLTLLLGLASAGPAQQLSAELRPFDPLDLLELETLNVAKVSPDKQWLLYGREGLDWKNNRRTVDLWLVRTDGSQRRRMTYSGDRRESAISWAKDSGAFLYLATDDKRRMQVFRMRVDGGEAQQITEEAEGVQDYALSPSGDRLAYRTGPSGARILKILDLQREQAQATTASGDRPYVLLFQWHPQGDRILFTSAEEKESLLSERAKKGFNVRLNDEPKSPRNLWIADLRTGMQERLTDYPDLSVYEIKPSPSGRWWAFKARTADRYGTSWDNELYLLDLEKGGVRRLTSNAQDEDAFSFSPDEKHLAFVGPDEGAQYAAEKIHLAPLPDGPIRELGEKWPYDAAFGYWAKGSSKIYFASTVGVNRQIYSMPLDGGEPEALTSGDHLLSLSYDREADALLVRKASPRALDELYFADPDAPADASRWMTLTDFSAQLADRAMGEFETVHWTSTDGQEVEGLLIKPVGYQEGVRYPLIVQVHGGPAGTSTNSFPGRWSTYSHVYAGRGYAVLQPNYRGSSGYGAKFRQQIAGNYFQQGFDDIMTGVDSLIERGLADPDRLGHMGWSAGGHWSNWALTHTDRFKAIASGAGAVNWISMWAQSDMQINREFYFEGKPYENREHYLEVSPIAYIENAKTPTLIFCGTADERVPNPQSRELYVNLKNLGVPVEYIEFPGQGHGLTNARYELVKMEAELAWFAKWIEGKDGWLDWRKLLDTVK
ncbi:MAG: prolyl oligopeptidase family serine peptidase [Acidobacteria bacterium]|nr:prolyl oligopeptidase family serine peptidase [Acidobacteriota bacterium]